MRHENEMKKKPSEESENAKVRSQRFSDQVRKDIQTRFKSESQKAEESDSRRPKSGKGV
jgi:hypothetical protein